MSKFNKQLGLWHRALRLMLHGIGSREMLCDLDDSELAHLQAYVMAELTWRRLVGQQEKIFEEIGRHEATGKYDHLDRGLTLQEVITVTEVGRSYVSEG